VALVVCSLVPYLLLTVAIEPLSDAIGKSIGMPRSQLEVAISLSAGAYAAGTVLAVQLAMHFPARRLLIGYEIGFLTASVLAAWAPTAPVFIVAFIAQGLLTGLLLIAAVPPLVTSWPPAKMPITGGIMNLCIFGAVAAGPSVGGFLAPHGGWRPLFCGIAALAALALALSMLTFRDDPAIDHSAPWDVIAVSTAFVGCAAAFFGVGRLQATMKPSPGSLIPLVAGAALIVFLVVQQYRARDPLMPVKAAFTTVPAAGIFAALTASAASFGVMELLLGLLRTAGSPGRTALIFIPEIIAAVAVAALFAALFASRYTPVLAIGGLLMIVAAAALFLTVIPRVGPALAVVTGLAGLGVAASVSPGLFLAGLSLPSNLLPRVFALIELLRGVSAFLIAPILVTLAGSPARAAATQRSAAICLAIAAIGFLGSCALYLGGRPRLEKPDLGRWQSGEGPAWESPPLLQELRKDRVKV
jgi:predicted MFS family arabinose efflux permease